MIKYLRFLLEHISGHILKARRTLTTSEEWDSLCDFELENREDRGFSGR